MGGVKLVSITQEMGDDPMHVMMRQIMALFDEYQSKENDAHRCGRKAGYARRWQFCSGLAEPEGFEPSIGLYNPITV